MSGKDCVRCGENIPKDRFVCPKCKTKQPSISAQKYYQRKKWEESIAEISLDASNQVLREEIIERIHDLTQLKVGERDSLDVMNDKLTAIIDQNNILLRQNELILRALIPSIHVPDADDEVKPSPKKAY